MEITNWFGLDGWFTLLTLLDKCVFLWFGLKDGARLDLMNDMTLQYKLYGEDRLAMRVS
jgi:hypothetical protein